MHHRPTPSDAPVVTDAPETEGIKYAGSKLKLVPYILSLLKDLELRTVLDGFAGTTRVAQAFAKQGYQVYSNDISDWSFIFGLCYLKNKKEPATYQELIDHLNAVPGYDGWFTEHYGGVDRNGLAIQDDGQKRLWQVHNTRKLDGIRDEIERLALDPIERAVALTSLILALDSVDNTMGHFSSYLRRWSARSYQQMHLQVPKTFINQKDHHVLKGDIFEHLPHLSVDFAYFDPPYGSNNEKMPPSRVRYASYYHVWTTICRHDRPETFGAAARRKDSSDYTATSIFEEYRRAADGRFIAVSAIDQLIQKVQARYVALSYSSGGKATAAELDRILNTHGKLIKTLEIDYKRNVMSGMRWTHDWVNDAENPNREFIFLIEKQNV